MEDYPDHCPGYIDNVYCYNKSEKTHTWCITCGKIFVKKMSKHKALEKKYYSEDHIIPANLGIEDLQKIHTKLASIISLRKYICDYGFCPERRDHGHQLRIENIKKYKKMIKLQLQNFGKIEVQNNIDALLEKVENLEKSQRSENSAVFMGSEKRPEEDETKKIIQKAFRRAMSIVSNALIGGKQETIEEFDTRPYQVITAMQKIIIKLIDGSMEIVENFVTPKLGANFWPAFCLQYMNMSLFCGHKSTKIIRGKCAMMGVHFGEIDHCYANDGKRLLENNQFISCSSRSEQTKYHLATGYINEILATKKFDIFLALYRQVTTIPLPKWIKKIIFNPTEKDFENLTTLHIASKVNKSHIIRRNYKIALLKSKRSTDYKYDIQSCMRTNLFGDAELYCTLIGTDDPIKYRLQYRSDSDQILTSTVDIADYVCPHTFTPIIVLDESVLYMDEEVLGVRRDQILDEHLEFMKQLCVLNLEAHTAYLFTF